MKLYIFILEQLWYIKDYKDKTQADFLAREMFALYRGQTNVHDAFARFVRCNDADVKKLFLETCRDMMSHYNDAEDVEKWSVWNYMHDTTLTIFEFNK